LDPERTIPDALRDRIDIRAYELLQREIKAAQKANPDLRKYPKPPGGKWPKNYSRKPRSW